MNLSELEKKLIRKRIVVLSERILEAEKLAARYFANLQQQRLYKQRYYMKAFEEHYNYTQDVIQRLREERLDLLRELNQVEPGTDEEEAALGLADGDPF